MAKKAKAKLKFNKMKFITTMFLLFVVVSVISVFLNQSQSLSNQAMQIKSIEAQIAEATKENEKLQNDKELALTPERKEDVARNRDGLVYPNELIFVDPLAEDQ